MIICAQSSSVHNLLSNYRYPVKAVSISRHCVNYRTREMLYQKLSRSKDNSPQLCMANNSSLHLIATLCIDHHWSLQELNEVRLEIKQRDLQLERAERQWQTADSERQTLELQLHNVQDTLHSTIRYISILLSINHSYSSIGYLVSVFIWVDHVTILWVCLSDAERRKQMRS